MNQIWTEREMQKIEENNLCTKNSVVYVVHRFRNLNLHYVSLDLCSPSLVAFSNQHLNKI